MTNKHKGEFCFEALGKTWTGRFSLNVLSEVEDRFDMGVEQFFQSIVEKPRLKPMIVVFYFGLKRNHSELTEELVGDLLQDVIERDGNFDALANMFQTAARAAFPEDKSAGGGAVEAAPDPTRQAQTDGGTGRA